MNWTEILAAAKDIINTWNWLSLFGVIGVTWVLIFLTLAQLAPGDGFDVRDLIAERMPPHGKRFMWRVDGKKAFRTGAFFATTWGFIWLIENGKMEPTYLLVYAGAWISDSVFNKLADAKAGAILSSSASISLNASADAGAEVKSKE